MFGGVLSGIVSSRTVRSQHDRIEKLTDISMEWRSPEQELLTLQEEGRRLGAFARQQTTWDAIRGRGSGITSAQASSVLMDRCS